MADKIGSRDNLEITREGSKLVITIELDEAKIESTRSKSGKSLVLSTTGRARSLENDLRLNLTLYRLV